MYVCVCVCAGGETVRPSTRKEVWNGLGSGTAKAVRWARFFLEKKVISVFQFGHFSLEILFVVVCCRSGKAKLLQAARESLDVCMDVGMVDDEL